MAFSQDGRLLASASVDETVHVWDATTGALRQTLTAESAVSELRFADDNSHLITNSGTLGPLDAQTGHGTLGNDVEVSAMDEWASVHGEKMLWLPPESIQPAQWRRRAELHLGMYHRV